MFLTPPWALICLRQTGGAVGPFGPHTVGEMYGAKGCHFQREAVQIALPT
jgi:hypothetical protein